jgi:hypothetical protein
MRETASFRKYERLVSVSVGSHFVRPLDWALVKVAVVASAGQSELRAKTAESPRVST